MSDHLSDERLTELRNNAVSALIETTVFTDPGQREVAAMFAVTAQAKYSLALAERFIRDGKPHRCGIDCDESWSAGWKRGWASACEAYDLGKPKAPQEDSEAPRVVDSLGRDERDSVWGWTWKREQPQHFSLYYRYRNGWQYSHDLNAPRWIPCEDERGRTWLPDADVPPEGGKFTEVLS